MTEGSAKARKSRRNPRACDPCSRRSVKCKPSTEDASRCQNCVDFDEPCTLERPMRKRGAQPKADKTYASRASSSALSTTVGTGPEAMHSSSQTPSAKAQQEWLSPSTQECDALILELVNVYFEIIFPIFPLFHKPGLLRKVASGEHLANRALYAAVTSLCALVIARARDGAVLQSKLNTLPLQNYSSESFFAAAEKAVPTTSALTPELGYMQAYMLLSITSIQYGDQVKARYHLNLYHNCVAVGLLHNEEEWPRGLSIDEIEERRRLFWSAYTLDVFTSLIWKGAVRSSEAMFNVCYPSKDDLLQYMDVSQSLRTTEAEPSWLNGWNFVTDLYRLLEHVLHRLRPKQPCTPMMRIDFSHDRQATTALLQQVTAMYHGLPTIFKCMQPPTHDVSKDLYSFQAANIAATVQLVRMVLFTIERSSVEEKCGVASEVIRVFANVPTAYLRAISSPLLHHLAGIGILLGSTLYEKLSETAYSHLRAVLLDFATLLSNLEIEMHYISWEKHSDKLRAQVATLDKYWTEQKQQPATQPSRTLDGPDPSSLQSPLATDYGPTPSYQSNPDWVSFPPELFEDWSSIFDFL